MMATYLDLYPKSITDGEGIVSTLSQLPDIPWAGMTIEAIQDLERLYGVRSGFKSLTAGILNSDEESRVRILATLFTQRWKRLWDNYALKYNPLDAYRVVESGTKNSVNSVNKSVEHGRQIQEEGTNSGTIDTETANQVMTTDSVYGFNSADGVPSGTGSENANGTDTETRNLTASRTITNSGTDTTAKNDTVDEEYQYEKSGNIGYSTPQELLRQEFELWRENFFDHVFNDIDSFIMLMVY